MKKKYLVAFRYGGWKDEKMTPSFPSDRITAINSYILDVCMARDMLILMRANPFLEPLGGVGPENRDFFGP
jgi:hypothetical protein